MQRRFAIGAGAVLVALTTAACGGGTPEATTADSPVTVQIGRAPAFPQLPLYVAEDRGFWNEGGINAEFVGVSSGPEATAAQVSGAIDIVDQIPSNMLGIVAKGVNLKAFTVTTALSQFDIIVDADYAVQAKQGDWRSAMKSLKGAKVGVIARGTATEDIARTLFKESGVDPEAQTYIATGLPTSTLAAMENGQIDMAITVEPAIAKAVLSGLATSPFSIRAGDAPDSLRWPGVVGTVTADYAKDNQEAMRRYAAVLERTLKWMRDEANREAVIAIMIEDLSIPADLAGHLYQNNIGDLADHVALTAKDVESLNAAGAWTHEIGKVATAYRGSDFTMLLHD